MRRRTKPTRNRTALQAARRIHRRLLQTFGVELSEDSLRRSISGSLLAAERQGLRIDPKAVEQEAYTRLYSKLRLDTGIVQRRKARSTGTTVLVCEAEPQGFDPDGGKYASCCETHSTIVNHENLKTALAHAATPEEWCEECMKASAA